MYYTKTHSKKKKIIISIIISIIVILSALFFLTPISTLYKFITGIKDKNPDKVIECVEPEKAAMLHDINNLLSDSLFKTLMNSLLPKNDDSTINYSDEISVTDYHIKGVKYNWFDKTSSAIICLDITDNSGNQSTLNLSVNFIRIGSKWYIDFISDANLQLDEDN